MANPAHTPGGVGHLLFGHLLCRAPLSPTNLITFGWRYQKRGFQTPNLIIFAWRYQKRHSPHNPQL